MTKEELPEVHRLKTLPQFAAQISPIMPPSEKKIQNKMQLDIKTLNQRIKKQKAIEGGNPD